MLPCNIGMQIVVGSQNGVETEMEMGYREVQSLRTKCAQPTVEEELHSHSTCLSWGSQLLVLKDDPGSRRELRVPCPE